MHPDRGTVRTYRRSDGLSTRTNSQNTFICQSTDTNDSPRDLLHGPITWNPPRTRPYSKLLLRLRLFLCLRLRPRASPPPSQSPRALHRCLKSPPIVTSGIKHWLHNWHLNLCAGSLFRLDSTQFVFNLIIP